MVVNVQILGLPEALSFIKSKGKRALDLCDKGMDKVGLYAEGEVKESIAGRWSEPASVDTGRFMSSVRGGKTGFLTAEVNSNVEYAQYLEYGTSRMGARRHFNNTKNRVQPQVINILKSELRNL